VGHHLLMGDSQQPLANAYDVAKAGGKHAGFLKHLSKMGPRQRLKAMRSFQQEVDTHLDKIADPAKYVDGWANLRESHRQSLLRGWQVEVNDHLEQMQILKGFDREQG
jgi:hypothetical protein